MKGLEGPTKTRVPVITWQDHHYVSTPIRSEEGRGRGGENGPRLRKGVKNIANRAAGHWITHQRAVSLELVG